jgi:hypothetical protein
MLKSLSLFKKMGIALVAILLTFAAAFGASTSANAATVGACQYTVSSASFRTTATIGGSPCLLVQAFIDSQNPATGSRETGKGASSTTISMTGQVLPPITILRNYATIKTTASFTVDA